MYVVKGQRNTALPSQAAEKMGLIEYHIEQTTKAPSPVMDVERQEIKKNLIAEYEEKVSEAPGAIQKQRRVSIPPKEKFDQILTGGTL